MDFDAISLNSNPNSRYDLTTERSRFSLLDSQGTSGKNSVPSEKSVPLLLCKFYPITVRVARSKIKTHNT